MDKKYYTIPEYAKILGLSRISVYQRVKKGQIKAHRAGKMYLIPKAETEVDKKMVDEAVKKTVKDYGEVLKKLGNE
ncbi:MAG: helix-turn-helix domain-containing protein [Elusimicrobia bacterium]|nr:helix-turn-helix domain-containing protein [Elusimicrobiota bacterium]